VVSGVFSIPLPTRERSSRRYSARADGVENRLEAFIGGPENRLALASIETLLHTADHSYNPLVLCGGVGTGKSLLSHGLASRWQEANGSRSGEVKLTDAESLAAEFHAARKPRRLVELRQRYRSASLVVIDDLHKLPTNVTIQRELCGMIDELTAKDEHGRSGQIIITSRTKPEMLDKFLPALVSRLTAGLTVPLAPAGRAARRAMVLACCEVRDLQLTDEAVDYLAAGEHPTTGDLPLTIGQLPQKRQQAPLSLSLVRQYVPRPTHSKKIRIDRVARVVAKYFSLSVADLKSDSRRRHIATARRILVYLAREHCEKSFSQIGKFLGGRDHTTVLYNHQKAIELLKSDMATQKAIADLSTTLEDQC